MHKKLYIHRMGKHKKAPKAFNKIAKVASRELVKIVAYCGDEVLVQFENGRIQSIYKSQLIKQA